MPQEKKTTLKAIALTQRGADGVALRDMPGPTVPEGWAKARMLAASVNHGAAILSIEVRS